MIDLQLYSSMDFNAQQLLQTEERETIVTLQIATLFKTIIGNCWKNVGVFLWVPEDELDSIDKSNKSDQEKAGAMLKLWRDREGHRATVGLLQTALNRIKQQRIADTLLDIAREEKLREGERKGEEAEEHQETCSSPLEGSEKWELDELRESLRKVKEMNQTVTRLKSGVDKLPRGQQNARRNEPLETMHNLLMEVAALKEVIEQKILVCIAENENVEGLREMIEKVRKFKQDFS